MPHELIVQHAFVERLDGNRVRARRAGDHIRDPDEMAAAKRSHPAFVVPIWADEPTPAGPAVSAPNALAHSADSVPAAAPAQP